MNTLHLLVMPDFKLGDLPAEGEPLGAMLTDDKEIEAYVNAIRPAVLAARGNRDR